MERSDMTERATSHACGGGGAALQRRDGEGGNRITSERFPVRAVCAGLLGVEDHQVAGAGFQRLFGGAEGGFLGVVHLFGVVLADAAAQVGKVGLDAVLLVLVDLLFALGEGLVHLVGQDLGLVVQIGRASCRERV